jgi:ribulose-5-phosphate 4-epimerase/fuculose-1-phosphate aldolase
LIGARFWAKDWASIKKEREMSLKAVETGAARMDEVERQGRIDLAAMFRIAVRYNWHEGIANHFSLAISEDGERFLMNPQGLHWSRIRASDLLLLDADGSDDVIGQGAGKAEPTAWHIHSKIHAGNRQARCVLHSHMFYTTTLACLKGYRLQMIDQNAMRFYNRIAYDDNFGGIALDGGEGKRIGETVEKDKSVLFMANHGVAVVAENVALAFDENYYLERACKLQVLALSTGREMHVVSDEVAEQTCRQWMGYPMETAQDHFDEMKAILDKEEPDYRD